MSFGKNPHLPKAQAAEQKAADAVDTHARALAYRDAAHQWDRAAARETPGKKRTEYEAHAERNRELACAVDSGDDKSDEAIDGVVAPGMPASIKPQRFVN